MQRELIYVPNTKLMLLEKFGGFFKINLSGEIRTIKEIEEIGIPLTKTPDFKELTNPNPLTSSLEYYLRKANVQFTLSKREDKVIQYLGLLYDKSICQFYLIKDKL